MHAFDVSIFSHDKCNYEYATSANWISQHTKSLLRCQPLTLNIILYINVISSYVLYAHIHNMFPVPTYPLPFPLHCITEPLERRALIRLIYSLFQNRCQIISSCIHINRGDVLLAAGSLLWLGIHIVRWGIACSTRGLTGVLAAGGPRVVLEVHVGGFVL